MCSGYHRHLVCAVCPVNARTYYADDRLRLFSYIKALAEPFLKCRLAQQYISTGLKMVAQG